MTTPERSAPSNALGGDVRAAFADQGALARAVGGFEPRASQQQMAEAVAAAIDDGRTLLAEAGTGTGKTLAYLIPAILSRRRVLVSTGTKNLQEQIFFKDLPALQDVLGVPFTATLMKGRSNYLCLHRLHTFDARETVDRAVFLPVIQEWAAGTDTGDRAELRDLPEDLPLWREISADADTCLGTDCPRHGDCFLTLMRQRASNADVVIVNHHLLCADASLRQSAFGEVIPGAETLVVDEAHQLEDVATSYFGVSCSNLRVDDLVRDAQRVLGSGLLDPTETAEALRAVARVGDRASAFFAGLSLARAPGTSDSRDRYTADALADHAERGLALAGALDGLDTTVAAAAAQEGALHEGAESICRRVGELRADLRFLLRADDPDFVFYLEARGRGLALRASPIDVSRLIGEALFSRFRSVVLTSATLTVEGSFAYLRERLGLRAADELSVPSEFDYGRQALVYLPRRMPPPQSPSFAEAVAREAAALLTHSRGRAFVLFTSYRMLRAVQPYLEMALPYPTLVQGSAPRSALIDAFRSTPNAVLLATSSFWQGVDVAGDSLSCVVIDKLPFSSPGDPVTAARIDAIKSRGGDAFADYQVPLAILSLQQGLGRLIRHRGDRGVLAVLDPRIKTMGYGRRFLASLPPAPVTHDLDAVGRFFK